MALYYVHRVLIACAVLFAWGFSYFLYRQYVRLDSPSHLLMAAGSAAVGLVMLGYLVYFNGVLRGMQRRPDTGNTGRP